MAKASGSLSKGHVLVARGVRPQETMAKKSSGMVPMVQVKVRGEKLSAALKKGHQHGVVHHQPSAKTKASGLLGREHVLVARGVRPQETMAKKSSGMVPMVQVKVRGEKLSAALKVKDIVSLEEGRNRSQERPRKWAKVPVRFPEGMTNPQYDAYFSAARGAASSVLRNPADAEQVASETMLAVHKEPYVPDKIVAFIRKAAKNRAINHTKKSGRETAKVKAASLEVASPSDTVASEVDRNEISSLAATVFSTLQKGEQEILKMKYEEGLSYNEIAERLKIKVSTVTNRLHAARLKFKEAASQIWVLANS